MLRLVIVIFVFTSVCFSQQTDKSKQSNQTEGEDITRKAREAIGLDKIREISSYFYKVKTSILDKTPNGNSNPDFIEEISLTLPDKIQAIYTVGGPLSAQSTKTWNGKKYKSIIETEFSGKRIVTDDTNSEDVKPSKNVAAVLEKKTASNFKNFKLVDSKEILMEELWTELFPLILAHPFESKLEFKYIGKAKSNDEIANVVDVKSGDEKTYRLLFNSQTNYLLMMIVNFKVNNQVFVGDIETKYYFSERELINGVLIPKKIKVEEKQIAAGRPPKITFRSMEIIEFKVNPEFKKDLFEIK